MLTTFSNRKTHILIIPYGIEVFTFHPSFFNLPFKSRIFKFIQPYFAPYYIFTTQHADTNFMYTIFLEFSCKYLLLIMKMGKCMWFYHRREFFEDLLFYVLYVNGVKHAYTFCFKNMNIFNLFI